MKGLDFLIDGFEQYFNENNDPVNLVLAGRSWKGSDLWILERIKSSSTSSGIRYLGEVSMDDKYRIFRESLALIYTSRYDGPPRPVREALGMGMYILASRQANVWTDLEYSEAGAVFNCDSIGVKQALSNLSSDEQRSCRDDIHQALS